MVKWGEDEKEIKWKILDRNGKLVHLMGIFKIAVY